MGEVVNIFTGKAHDKKPDVASAIIVTPDDKILVFERFCKQTGEIFYDVPGGKQEPHETSLLQALRREVGEELGIDIGETADMLGNCPSPSPKAAGSLRYFYGVFDYEGVPEDKLGRDEGHLALLHLDPADAIQKLNGRISPDAIQFIQHVADYRAVHEQNKKLIARMNLETERAAYAND